MARRADGSDQALVELKAVDAAYPLYGTLEGEAGPIAMAHAGADGISGRIPLLLERLGGQDRRHARHSARRRFELLGAIIAEPDRLSDGTVSDRA